jgi:phosphogluconate dehydratase
MKPAVLEVTQRITERSAATRAAYLARIARLQKRPPGAARMGCANVAHAFAALPANDKLRVVAQKAPNIGIVTAYNDMLSAHQPYENYPALIREQARALGATVQVAGGVPAMCDGVTQGMAGMELSLFSRDTIAMSTAVALSHDVFDAALLLGVCDKIVPGLLIGALHFGHLPCVFVPAGPMSSGLSNNAKSKVREQFAQGQVGRDELLKAESAAYHGPGTCTFYRQQQPDAAGSHGAACAGRGFHPPARRPARGADAPGGGHAAGHHPRRQADAHRPAGGRTRHRQRHAGLAGHRRQHQPPDPLGGRGPQRGHRHRLV